jgi:asparagine synthase (glutamine-hydrolysing)
MAPNPGLAELTEAEWIERIDDRLKASVDAQTKEAEHLGIALSGGLDARTMLGLTDHQQVEMTCFSLGMEGSLDVKSARELARLAGYPYHVCTLDENFLGNFSQHLERMVELTDGHYLSQCIVLPTFSRIREWGIQVLLRGHAGELMHLNKAYNFSLDQSVWQIRDQASLEAWLLKRLPAYMLEAVDGSLLVQANTSERESHVRESMREALAETTSWETPINRISHLFLTQRLRRETALSLMKFQSVTETRLPFMDSRLIELLLSCPPRLRIGETVQAAMLRRHMPTFLAPANSDPTKPYRISQRGIASRVACRQ